MSMAADGVNNAPEVIQEGLALTFKDLSYAVQIKKTKAVPAHQKQILKNLTGICKAGRILAIMGPSGAGKTSLLDILAGRKYNSSGQICLGTKANTKPSDIAKQAAYVQQDDAIMASQTVREAITMSALLTLPAGVSRAAKIQKAEEMIDLFHLQTCADTVVGDPAGSAVKGISGGERKRTAVAMNSVREPRMIFLDEPTSGLDSHKAFVLIKLLKALAADRHATVVCTIHQPSSDIFALFDDFLLLLAGREVFNGNASSAVSHFASAGFPCPQYANPTDYFFMHVLVATDGSAADEKRVEDLAKAWSQSDLKSQVNLEVATMFKSTQELTGTTPKSSTIAAPAPRANFGTQFQVLFKRSMNDIKRNPMRGKAQVGQAVAFAVIISLIWWQVQNDQNGVQDRSGVLFFMTANGMMNNIMGVLTTFANERGAVLREQENNMYDTLPYFLSRIAVDIPMKIICPCLFATIAYWSVGLKPTGEAYLTCLAIVVLLALCGNGIGLFLACIFSDVAVALLVAPLCILPLMMFSGFFLNPESTPVYLKWLEFMSPMKYSFSALAMNEFRGLEMYCTPDQVKKVQRPDGSVLEICPIQKGQDFLDNLNIQEYLSIEVCCLLLGLGAVLFTLLAFVGLTIISNRTRAKSRASAKLEDVTAKSE